jgi:hypothetical protein
MQQASDNLRRAEGQELLAIVDGFPTLGGKRWGRHKVVGIGHHGNAQRSGQQRAHINSAEVGERGSR